MYKCLMSSKERFRTFEEFWPFYVREHSKKSTRTIHFIGTTAVMGLVAYAAISRKKWPLFVAPFAGYGPAWFSHFSSRAIDRRRSSTRSGRSRPIS